YFNSFNNSKFTSVNHVVTTIKKDISSSIEAVVEVNMYLLDELKTLEIQSNFNGECIDGLDVTCDIYHVHPNFLQTHDDWVEETLYSNLLKSNCLITSQPDWASVQICYKGKKIDRQGLLKYIVSFRNHNEFHEQCIERIFIDIMQYCQPEMLSVYGRYTRRGGIDINPYRTSKKTSSVGKNFRLVRQ
ncbi:MAG: NADPH-dependent 7-cyano-7-deazaguanine reductase QueF, partial [Pseudomonadota bacterium]